jgi:hypothetical protein
VLAHVRTEEIISVLLNLKLLGLICRAPAGAEVGCEIAWEKLNCAFDRRPRHGNQVAKAFAFIKSQDFAELLEDRLTALPLLNFFKQRCEGVGLHATRWALAARFDRKEF